MSENENLPTPPVAPTAPKAPVPVTLKAADAPPVVAPPSPPTPSSLGAPPAPTIGAPPAPSIAAPTASAAPRPPAPAPTIPLRTAGAPTAPAPAPTIKLAAPAAPSAPGGGIKLGSAPTSPSLPKATIQLAPPSQAATSSPSFAQAALAGSIGDDDEVLEEKDTAATVLAALGLVAALALLFVQYKILSTYGAFGDLFS